MYLMEVPLKKYLFPPENSLCVLYINVLYNFGLNLVGVHIGNSFTYSCFVTYSTRPPSLSDDIVSKAIVFFKPSSFLNYSIVLVIINSLLVYILYTKM
jgi:hypothetical protein